MSSIFQYLTFHFRVAIFLRHQHPEFHSLNLSTLPGPFSIIKTFLIAVVDPYNVVVSKSFPIWPQSKQSKACYYALLFSLTFSQSHRYGGCIWFAGGANYSRACDHTSVFRSMFVYHIFFVVLSTNDKWLMVKELDHFVMD